MPLVKWNTNTVDVKIQGLDDTMKQTLIDYVEKSLYPLGLGFTFNWDVPNLNTRGGISYYYGRGLPEAFNTRATGAFNTDMEPIQIAQISMDLDILELYPAGKNRDNAFLNSGLHEMVHALGFPGHLEVLPAPMPRPLLCRSLSSSELMWTMQDKLVLLDLYEVNYKTRKIEFKPKQVGKVCDMLHTKDPDKSFSFDITSTKMYIPALDKGSWTKRVR